MTREEQIDWLCRLRADLNNGVIFTPWNKEFTEALNEILELAIKVNDDCCETENSTTKNDLVVGKDANVANKDCISRQQAIDVMTHPFIDLDTQKFLIGLLKVLPSVTPQELDKIKAELIQSIQNGTLKIESGNEELFRIIDKYRVFTNWVQTETFDLYALPTE
jgi:hypothetical protein